jgi:hypothetical protein
VVVMVMEVVVVVWRLVVVVLVVVVVMVTVMATLSARQVLARQLLARQVLPASSAVVSARSASAMPGAERFQPVCSIPIVLNTCPYHIINSTPLHPAPKLAHPLPPMAIGWHVFRINTNRLLPTNNQEHALPSHPKLGWFSKHVLVYSTIR